MSEEEIEAWAERIWQSSTATKLDKNYRKLAAAVTERIADDPELAALVLAAIVQEENGGRANWGVR